METDDKKEVLPSVFDWQKLISKASGGRSFKIGFFPKDYRTKMIVFDDRFKFEFRDVLNNLVEIEFSGFTAEEAENKFINFFLGGGECFVTVNEDNCHFRITLSLSHEWIIN